MNKSKYRVGQTTLIIIITYLVFTYISYLILYGLTSALLFFFNLTIYIAIIIGFFLSKNKKTYNTQRISYRLIRRLIIFSSIVTLIFCINFIFVYYKDINELIYYILRPGESYEHIKYLNRHNLVEDSAGLFGSSLLSIVLTLLSGTKYVLLIFSVLYWRRLSYKLKFLALTSISFYLIYSFLIGAMINIGVVFISLIPVILLSNKGWSFSKNKKLYFIMSFSVLIVFFFIIDRIGNGEGIVYPLRVLFDYLAQGYHGVELSFQVPFTPTYGFTSIRAVSLYLVKYFNFPDLFQFSYLVKVESMFGYPALSKWSTIYPWLASDFTYFSIPVIFLLISKSFFKILKKANYTTNPFTILLVGQLFIFWFMIPANNQLFHTLANMSSFIMILLLYLKYGNTRKCKYEI